MFNGKIWICTEHYKLNQKIYIHSIQINLCKTLSKMDNKALSAWMNSEYQANTFQTFAKYSNRKIEIVVIEDYLVAAQQFNTSIAQYIDQMQYQLSS